MDNWIYSIRNLIYVAVNKSSGDKEVHLLCTFQLLLLMLFGRRNEQAYM
jgi:hypothetical protein